MNFLKIGDTILNLDRAIAIDLHCRKRDGSGDHVTFAIDDGGDVPTFHRFSGLWGDAVRAFFRGDGGHFLRTGVWEVDVPAEPSP